MTNILQQLWSTLIHNQNQFASGGLFLMAIGSIGALFRSVPEKVWFWFVHQTTISLTITDDNVEYKWLKSWLQEQRIMHRGRHLDIGTGKKWRTEVIPTVLSPAPGHHWMWWNGRALSVTMARIDDTKSDERRESIKFTTIGRKQKFFRKMVEAVRLLEEKRQTPDESTLHIWKNTEWSELTPYYPRPLDTVLLPGDLKKELIRDIETFKASRSWYTDMGIPYHRGYLFEGPAGSGKTSLVIGLSSYFKAKVHLLKIAEMTDATLLDSVMELPANSFVVLEDIDCIGTTSVRKKDEKDKSEGSNKGDISQLFGVSLSGLLNILDGILAPSGTLFFMTTNHVEKLDPALIRPGRVDFRYHLGLAEPNQKIQLYNRFFPNENIPQKFLEKEMSMAELQQELMKKRSV